MKIDMQKRSHRAAEALQNLLGELAQGTATAEHVFAYVSTQEMNAREMAHWLHNRHHNADTSTEYGKGYAAALKEISDTFHLPI